MNFVRNILVFLFIAMALNGFSQSSVFSEEEARDSINSLLEKSGQFRHISTDSSMKFAGQAVKLALLYSLPSEYANAKVARSYALLIRGEQKDALKQTNDAYEIFVRMNDLSGIMNCYKMMGIIYSSSGDYVRSIDYQMKAIRIAEVLKDTMALANLYNNTGLIYYYQGEDDKALDMFSKTHALFACLNKQSEIGVTYSNIGIIYCERGDYTKGKQYYFKALALGAEQNDLNILGSANQNLGQMYLILGVYDTSIMYFEKALAIQKELGMILNICSTLKGLGDIYSDQGQDQKALQYYHEAAEIADKTGVLEKLKDIYWEMMNCYARQNDFKKAFEYQTKSYGIRDSISNVEVARQIKEVESKYALAKKNVQIDRLNYEKKADNKVIEQQEIQIYIFITAIIIACILLFGLWIQTSRKTTAFKELVLRNLELMARERRLEQERISAKENMQKEEIKLDIILPKPVTDENDDSDLSIDKGVQNSDMHNSGKPSQQDKVKYEKSVLTEEQKKYLLNKIIDTLENEKLYLDPDLSIDSLAAHLNVYKKYISQVINEVLGKNFITFINEYRIRESRKILISQKHNNYSIEGIAKTVGFQSKVTFNAAFKKFTGLTPSYFRDEALRDQSKEQIITEIQED